MRTSILRTTAAAVAASITQSRASPAVSHKLLDAGVLPIRGYVSIADHFLHLNQKSCLNLLCFPLVELPLSLFNGTFMVRFIVTSIDRSGASREGNVANLSEQVAANVT